MGKSNIYSTGAASIAELFKDYLDGSVSSAEDSCIALALSTRILSTPAQTAIDKSLAALGFAPGACTYATLLPQDAQAEGGDIALDAQALFMLIEGLDPLRVICCDAMTARAVAEAYRTAYPLDDAARVFGRPAAMFKNLETLMESDDGKQKAWRVLKTLKR